MFSLLCVVSVLSFLQTSLVMTAGLYFLRLSQNQNQSLYQSLDRKNQRLTDLAAAKDLETFRHLTNIVSPEKTTSAFSEANSIPLDDVSVSKRLAASYVNQGIDPTQAFSTDPMEDFGGFGTLL